MILETKLEARSAKWMTHEASYIYVPLLSVLEGVLNIREFVPSRKKASTERSYQFKAKGYIESTGHLQAGRASRRPAMYRWRKYGQDINGFSFP